MMHHRDERSGSTKANLNGNQLSNHVKSAWKGPREGESGGVAHERLTEARKVEPPMDCCGWKPVASAHVKYGRNMSSSSLQRGGGGGKGGGGGGEGGGGGGGVLGVF